ncbi:MAG TPA: xanthine dehydrogenase family protein molybdopterin-binding subunit [Terriglobales bacterium]|jgi:isoquinoline 1-oxidoreductase subunit beta|nr:xanthine dehydrogenase family protein molybdopterin-binding subunit [Terriglobales bacterium]
MSDLSRRGFLTAGVVGGTGLVIGFYLKHNSNARRSGVGEAFSPNAYLKITPDNKITVVVARSEMGQGVRTALPMILAEELDADWKTIRIEQAGASTLFGDQSTGGSASVRTTWDPMRKAGATAREMLISAAALQWSVGRDTCKAENGAVIHTPTNRKATYGELASKAATLAVPTDAPLKKPADYKIVGTRLPRIDTPSKTNGTAEFGIDFRLPGMKYAFLERCPVFGGKVANFDDGAAKQVSGVTYVGKIGDSSVAVVADSIWAAMEGRRALKVTWDEGPHKDLTSAAVMDGLKKATDGKSVSLYSAGNVTSAAGRRHTAEYELPFMCHAPMEPGNCTAHFQGSKLEMWAPTQVPQDCRDTVAQLLSLPPEKVIVNVTLMGGGFGRRLEHDYAVEAALVSKAINGPVKVMWTREDDMKNSPYRPSSFHKLTASLDSEGYPAAFTHRIIAPSISAQKGYPIEGGVDPDLKDEAPLVYPFANASLEYVQTESAIPLAWMRAVYALQVGFASESFIDELAAAAGKDPLEYRLHILSKDTEIKYFDATWHPARMKAVLEMVRHKSGWGQPLPAGHHRGVACFGCFSTYMAEVVEISMEGNKPKVHRVVAVTDCGQVVNPAILEQQIQGGIVYGLANALRAQITIDKGRTVQANFDEYSPIRMNECPKVEAYFVQSTESPTGIGEPSIPPLAPAICNAIFAATKKRVRKLPILSS